MRHGQGADQAVGKVERRADQAEEETGSSHCDARGEGGVVTCSPSSTSTGTSTGVAAILPGTVTLPCPATAHTQALNRLHLKTLRG